MMSCKSFELQYSSNAPFYRIENKFSMNTIYYIKVSKLNDPTVLETKEIGYATWTKLKNGNLLDSNYCLIK